MNKSEQKASWKVENVNTWPIKIGAPKFYMSILNTICITLKINYNFLTVTNSCIKIYI